jgi:UDP-N-acetylglucosamine 2-epimerase (hydrolysing)
MRRRRVLFLTGTRADFGKLKPLMQAVMESPRHECVIFATGMHLLSRYGMTVDEVYKAGFRNIYTYMNQIHGEPMELVLANTITGLSRFLHEEHVDLLVVHGDRVEALAGATVGALRNLLVAHIEGGELSGTVDELIRHAVTKLSHVHFVANAAAADRLRQLGEAPQRTYVIGSPDVDVMLSESLPRLDEARQHYDIRFPEYGIVLFHPVTTQLPHLRRHAKALVDALLASGRSYIVIYPNNDPGCSDIFAEYERLTDHPRFRVFPSIRFEYFLVLLRHARFMIGNSSAGVREAPVYGVPSVNIGDRQHNRFRHPTILDAAPETPAILDAIATAGQRGGADPCHYFGDGRSAQRFMEELNGEALWETPTEKQFLDQPTLAGL